MDFWVFTPYIGECLLVQEGARFPLMRGFLNWMTKTDVLNVLYAVSHPDVRAPEPNVISNI